MDPLLDARLKAIENKLDETTKILVAMRRAQKTAAVMKWLYWLVIIGVGIMSLYLIQPYLEQLKGAYGLLGGSGEENSSGTDYGALLDQLKEFQANQ
ncbi:MAG: hypothetical protein ACOYMZ_03660 [Minisyncoccia bacterium]